jgi:hypothetical protein
MGESDEKRYPSTYNDEETIFAHEGEYEFYYDRQMQRIGIRWGGGDDYYESDDKAYDPRPTYPVDYLEVHARALLKGMLLGYSHKGDVDESTKV